MKRKALIIGSPDENIPGVFEDMKNYRTFLQSPQGGLWYEDEIRTIQSPTEDEVEHEMRRLRGADYSLAVFAGHGEHSIVEDLTLLTLQPGLEISENMLKRGAPKHTLIIDACRVGSMAVLREEFVRTAVALDSFRNISLARIAFDLHIEKCHPGLAVMYACDIGEAAGEEANRGGDYSYSLLRHANSWSGQTSHRNEILTVRAAHSLAEAAIKKSSVGTQNPRGRFLRAQPSYPFAVSF